MTILEKLAKGMITFHIGIEMTEQEKDHEELETRGYIFTLK